jgi:hypothetical protein
VKTWQHILFWVAVHASLTFIFGKWFESYVEAFYYVSLLLPVVMATSYFFNYYLVPRYLFTRRFFLFGLYTVYMFIVSLCLELLASVSAMLLIVHFGVSATGPLVTDVFTLAVILYFIVLFKSFILLIKHYFIDQGAILRLEEEKKKMEEGFILVKSQRKDVRIEYRELNYIESLSDYICFHLEGREDVRSKEKISHIERELPGSFLRIHRSFIVNTAHITSFNREEVQLDETVLPISRSYRKLAAERLKL